MALTLTDLTKLNALTYTLSYSVYWSFKHVQNVIFFRISQIKLATLYPFAFENFPLKKFFQQFPIDFAITILDLQEKELGII